MLSRKIFAAFLLGLLFFVLQMPAFSGAAFATVFQNSDVAFLIKSANGSFVVADTGNVRNPDYVKAMTVLYDKLGSNAEFRQMVGFYKDSYRLRVENEKKTIARNIADLESMTLAAKENKPIISYYRAQLAALDSKKAPPLTVVFDPATKDLALSHMVPEKIVYNDKNGRRVEAPNYIVYEKCAVDYLNNSDASESVKGIITFAHESGHIISNNTSGPATIDYRDTGASYVKSDQYKDVPEAAAIMKKGDPLAGTHWNGKVTNPSAAFEEGFAEFSGAFFGSSGHDADNIADGNFYMYRDAYYIQPQFFSGEKYAGTHGATYQLKTTEELLSTEFFVAKMLYRVSKSFKDPNSGYAAIMRIKNSPEFAADRGFSNFVKIFARDYPQNYEYFRDSLKAEAEAKKAAAKDAGSFWARLSRGFENFLISLKLKKPTLNDVSPQQRIMEAEALVSACGDIARIGDTVVKKRTLADPGTAVTTTGSRGDGAVPQKKEVSPAQKARLDACFKRYIDYMGSPDADPATLERYKNEYQNALEEMKKATAAASR